MVARHRHSQRLYSCSCSRLFLVCFSLAARWWWSIETCNNSSPIVASSSFCLAAPKPEAFTRHDIEAWYASISHPFYLLHVATIKNILLEGSCWRLEDGSSQTLQLLRAPSEHLCIEQSPGLACQRGHSQ